MKVKEFIKLLEALNQDAEVIVVSSNFELKGATVAVSHVFEYKEGSKKTKVFRDAFDGEHYNVETWSVIGGDIPVVLVS